MWLDFPTVHVGGFTSVSTAWWYGDVEFRTEGLTPTRPLEDLRIALFICLVTTVLLILLVVPFILIMKTRVRWVKYN
jgi:hypothetical protein